MQGPNEEPPVDKPQEILKELKVPEEENKVPSSNRIQQPDCMVANPVNSQKMVAISNGCQKTVAILEKSQNSVVNLENNEKMVAILAQKVVVNQEVANSNAVKASNGQERLGRMKALYGQFLVLV